MKKELNPPKYNIGDAVGYYRNDEDEYRISRILGIVNYDDEYKYLLDEDITSDTEIDITSLIPEDNIIDILNIVMTNQLN